MSDELLGTLINEVKALRATVETAGRNATMPREYFDREEAAQYLRISIAKLDREAAQGKIKRAKLGDGQTAAIIYRKCDLDAYHARHCLQTADEARLRVKA